MEDETQEKAIEAVDTTLSDAPFAPDTPTLEAPAALTPEQIQAKELEDYIQFKNDPENIKKAYQLSEQILGAVGKNWFTLSRACAKVKLPRAEMYQKIAICKEFGFIDTKVGEYKDGREQLFKVVISKEMRREAILDVIKYHENQIESLKTTLIGLQ